MTAAVLTGDCIETMRRLPADSISAIVTDPPYGMSEHKPDEVRACLAAWLSGEEYRPKGKKGFMGRSWDAWVPGPEVWAEALRVAKPGAHLVAFAAPRTVALMEMAIRLAGWEIRDQLAWIYGSGFPKSHDVSKAIDKMRDRSEDRRPLCRWLRETMTDRGVTSQALASTFGFHPRMVDHWAARDSDSQPSTPSLEQFYKILGFLDYPEVPEEIITLVISLNDAKGQPGEAWFRRKVLGTGQGRLVVAPGQGEDRSGAYQVTAPATEAAARWSGWGTALKPAQEPIILARKPLAGTVAANVMAHGTGALNIDACRIEPPDPESYAAKGASVVGLSGPRSGVTFGGDSRTRQDSTHAAGRWPANLILDEEAAALLDAEVGESTSRIGKPRKSGKPGDGYGMTYTGAEYSDSGGPSRFFYTAKASRSEREAGLADREARRVTDGRETSIDNPYQRGDTKRLNTHPTVKPIALMRWLVRLITPPGGIVLDPFTGSGSTGAAAVLEGMEFLGCEVSEEYAEIARARIAHWQTVDPERAPR